MQNNKEKQINNKAIDTIFAPLWYKIAFPTLIHGLQFTKRRYFPWDLLSVN